MSSRLAFQTQLASIMEVLANAAVAEICKLVDDDYAVVSLQMSQCQRENKALKRKLHLLELKMARGNAERRLRESAINGGRPRIQISGGERLREVANTASASPTCTDGGFQGQMEVTLWSSRTATGEPELIHTEHVQTKPAVQSPDVELVEAEAAQVKEEKVEATLSRLTEAEEVLIRDDGVVEPLPRGSGQRPGLHQDNQSTSNQTPTTAPTLTPTLGSRRQRGSRGVEKTDDEDDVVLVKVEGMEEGTETQSQTSLSIQEGLVESSTDDFRANLPFDDLTQSSTNQLSDLQENGQGLSESAESTPVMSHDPGSVVTVQLIVPDTVPDSERTRVRSTARTSARSDFSLFDLESFFTRWAPDSESASGPGGPSCSFTNHDSAQGEEDQVIIVEGEAQHEVQAPQEAAGRLSGVCQTRTQAVPSASAPQRVQAPPPQPLWTRSSALVRSAQAAGVRPAQTTAPSNPPKAASSSAQHRASFLSRHNKSLAVGMGPSDRRRKRYMCRACGKAFSGVSNLEAHERVHTGEKPFSCDTCGKRFSEAGNLKKHQRVHTGEKPFRCERCGKTFAWICNLRTHQQSATGCGAQGRSGSGLS